MPAVSVIIPIYNRQEFIENTIKETLKQTLQDIEIICVDDGSTDNSWEILQNLVNVDSRIRIFHQENSGAGSSRNKGIKEAIGEYLFFLDSDDQIFNYDTLESLYDVAKENEANICGGRLLLNNDDGISVVESTDSCDYGYVKYFDYQLEYYFTRYIYRRNFIQKNNIYFPDTHIYEDPVFLVDAMKASQKFYQTNSDVYLYNYISRDKRVFSLEEIKDYLHGVNHNLNVAVDSKYEKLHYSLYKSLIYDICPCIINELFPNIDDELLRLLLVSNSLLDTRVLKKYEQNISDNLLLTPIKYLLETSKSYYRVRNNIIIKNILKVVRKYKWKS